MRVFFGCSSNLVNSKEGKTVAISFKKVFVGRTPEEAMRARDEWEVKHGDELEILKPQGNLVCTITVRCAVKDSKAAVPKVLNPDDTASGSDPGHSQPMWNAGGAGILEAPRPANNFESGCGGCADCDCGHNPK